jgi:hypothetical protein
LPVSWHETVEKDHGRIETRRALRIGDLFWMDAPLREYWPKLLGVGILERTCEIKGKISRERAYFIGSKGGACAKAFATAARRHWGIENFPHWVLDVTFREDGCRVRKGYAPRNFSALRKSALALLRRDATTSLVSGLVSGSTSLSIPACFLAKFIYKTLYLQQSIHANQRIH